MTEQNNDKITIKYKGKEYEIVKKKEGQKVKPKGEISIASTDNEITVKNYNEGFWTHSCECNGERIDIKWGKGRHITIWGSSSILLASFGLAIWYFGFRAKKGIKTQRSN